MIRTQARSFKFSKHALMHAALLALLLPLLTACPPREFHGDDAKMMEAAKKVADAIDNYHITTTEWPGSLDEVTSYMAYGEPWPTNPYNGKPLADTGSPDFDPATSVGMVYLQKIQRDDRVVNCQLHVFGDKGKLYIIGNTAFGLKE